jgi:hypothetical protein
LSEILINTISATAPIVIKAVNALFNKHPDTSILVKFDQNGNLVTLKGEAYTPTGDTRVNSRLDSSVCWVTIFKSSFH